MKLIIDIDDNVFTRLFDNGVETNSDDREVIDRAVRNGMPYEDRPQGDLISRSYLKQMIPAPIEDEYKHVHQIIDNAPTVPMPDFKEGYKQGKWIKIFENPFTNGYVCSICGHEIHVTEQFLPKVTECEACGAEMKSDIQKSCYTCKYKAGCPKSEVCQECRGFDHYEKAVQK